MQLFTNKDNNTNQVRITFIISQKGLIIATM